MKGYTIQNSIELLEKKAGSGSGGASTAAQVSYDNTSSGLTADDVQEAIDELKGDIPGIAQYGANYSTTEHVVGTWLDGITPVYEKTFDCGALPVNTTKNVAHGITDLAYVISIDGTAFMSNAGLTIPLPYVHYNSLVNCVEVKVEGDNIVIRDANTGYGDFSQSYVTLRYTKIASEAKTTRKKSSK